MPADRLKTITISGFKSIKQAQLDLGALSVMIGPNGSGKSNLAAVFRLLHAWVDRSLQIYVAKSGGGNVLFHFGAKRTPKIGIEMEFSTAAVQTAGLTLWHGENDQLMIWSEYLDNQAGHGFFKSGSYESRFPELLSNGFQGDARLRFLRKIKVVHFHDTTAEARIRVTGDLHDNHSLHGDGRNLAAFLYKLQQTKPEHFRLIENTTRLVAPFFERFALAPDGLNPNAIRLRWREAGADEDFGVEVLSDGTLRFIALAAMLLQPKEDLPSLLFIDEPELGLHPYALTVLAGLVRQASHDCQIIVATQSPTFLDQFGPENVIVVDRENRATTFKRLEPAELEEWLQEYTLSEIWEKNIFGGRPHR